MGLLDQVLGQVLGGQLGGSVSGSRENGSARGGASGGYPPQPGTVSSGGGLSPLVLALLALVGSRVLHQGAGGLGSKLRDLVTGQVGAGQEGPAGDDRGGLETAGLPGGGGILGGDRPSSGGGFLDAVGGLLDNPHPGGDPRESGGERRAPAGVPPEGPGGGGFGGGLVSGGLGGLLGSGLGGLLGRFEQNGRGDVMNSWLGSGPNQPISPADLGSALGDDTVDTLARETGLGRGDLLSQLSQTLPQVVDRLTPEGRLPTQDEEANWV
ncbi:MAG: hypothetical protein JWR08_1372 [Enterovirga sp.]|nr:hypothetical protein [Enterovirga sp.]